jgi:hypothetical protein
MKQIVAIRLSTYGSREEHIINVLLSDKTIKTVQAVAFDIDHLKMSYFYYTSIGRTAFVETAVSQNGNKFIRTKRDSTTANNLLSLPKF